MSITSEQIRAGRAIFRWKLIDLAEHSGVSVSTLQRMEEENGAENTLAKNVNAVQRALEEAGIEFIPANSDGGVGIRLRKPLS